MNLTIKGGKRVYVSPLHVHGRVDIPIQRDLHVRVSQHLAEAFHIRSPLDAVCRKCVSQYSQIKMDMYSDTAAFVKTKQALSKLIEKVNESGVDDMPNILSDVYDQAKSEDIVSMAYADEYYLKVLIMILIHRYCYGGEIK